MKTMIIVHYFRYERTVKGLSVQIMLFFFSHTSSSPCCVFAVFRYCFFCINFRKGMSEIQYVIYILI